MTEHKPEATVASVSFAAIQRAIASSSRALVRRTGRTLCRATCEVYRNFGVQRRARGLSQEALAEITQFDRTVSVPARTRPAQSATFVAPASVHRARLHPRQPPQPCRRHVPGADAEIDRAEDCDPECCTQRAPGNCSDAATVRRTRHVAAQTERRGLAHVNATRVHLAQDIRDGAA
jgi:hypothetical protein